MVSVDKDYKFRKATLLDIPYIFKLIQEGSLIGSFSNALMTSKGYFLLLRVLFPDVLKIFPSFRRKEKSSLWVFSLNKDEIGFIKTKALIDTENVHVLELCAIDPSYRNQKHGSHMLQMYIDSLPMDVEVIAHCTKYSRAMQHILIKHGFKRDSKNSFPLECYRFSKNPLTRESDRGG